MEDIGTFPDIDVPWDELENAATDMSTGSGNTKSYLDDAQAAWKRLHGAYSHDETQATVYAALDELTTPVSDWKDALKSAKTAISDFVATGRKLQKESEALGGLLPGLKSKVTADPEGEDSGTTNELTEFNSRARALRTDWSTAQSTAVEALDAITTGTGGSLPMEAALGGPSLPTVTWADFTAGLDEDFGAVDPVDLLPSLRGLSTDELRAWADANPEASKVLANNKLMGPFLPGSPEAAMAEAMDNGSHTETWGIDRVRETWLGLDAKDQEKLLLLYPGLIGNLNGVPMANRAKANIITVAGYREQTHEQLEDYPPEPQRSDYSRDTSGGRGSILGDRGTSEFIGDHAAWLAEKRRLETVAQGLDYAMDHDTQVVLISTEGDGRVVAMNGTPSSSTNNVSTLIPGTGADLGELGSYTDRLDAIDGKQDSSRVSFYWQGADLPDELDDNLTSKYNDDGGPSLAAFDYAVDAEVPESARTSYVGYSAGAPLLGTAERQGLDSTNIIYVAPAGVGHDVGSPDDTDNENAHRYWVQTRDDPIQIAQDLGGGFHGPSFIQGSNPALQMGATRLETGFVDPDDPDSLMSGHTDYFGPRSTAAMNIAGIIDGTRVSRYVPDMVGMGPGGQSYSPVEKYPERYSGENFEMTDVTSLEDE